MAQVGDVLLFVGVVVALLHTVGGLVCQRERRAGGGSHKRQQWGEGGPHFAVLRCQDIHHKMLSVKARATPRLRKGTLTRDSKPWGHEASK